MSTAPRLAVVIGALIFAVAGAGQVAAHAELVELDPAADATLDEPPPRVVARFDEELRVERSWIELVDGTSNVVARGSLDFEDLERRTLMMAVPPELPDGVYTVRWHTGSVTDEHIVPGEARFAVGEMGAAALTALDSALGTDDGDRSVTGWFASATLAVAAVAVFAGIVVRRGRMNSCRRDDERVEVG